MVSHIVTYWKEYVLAALALIILIQWIVILKQSRQKKTELTPIINEVRKELRRHHLSQQKLFSEIDYLLSEVPGYIHKKVKNLAS